jgi:hypothetical protein
MERLNDTAAISDWMVLCAALSTAIVRPNELSA